MEECFLNTGTSGKCHQLVFTKTKGLRNVDQNERDILSLRTGVNRSDIKKVCHHHYVLLTAKYSWRQRGCCNPFGKHKKAAVRRELRIITLEIYGYIKDIAPDAVPGKKLCIACGIFAMSKKPGRSAEGKIAKEIAHHSPPTSPSSSETVCLDDKDLGSSESDVNVEELNRTLTLLEETPVKKRLKVQLARVEKELFLTEREIQSLLAKQQELQVKRDELKFQLQQESAEKLANLDWERKDHPWSKKLDMTLQQTFKITKLRSYQLSTMNATLSGQDCILIMPTGGGKSLCFQLPALLSTGVTLVVSPLVSLMEDQLMALRSLDIRAEMLSASCNKQDVNNIQKEMTEKNSVLKLLYVTPEKLAKSKRFMAKLEKMYQIGNFARLAIDEVHCCSQWGHDFRPDYKFLGIMKRQFPKVPIIGLTATATSKVVSDVQKILNIPGCLVLKASFNRPNLKYEVCPKEASLKDTIEQLVKIISGRFKNQSGIIYCFSVKESETVASNLKKCGIKARAYHAQLDAETRSKVHRSWSRNETQVVVATVAFGMGIDKPDVRFVIHHSLSKSMENFYQESGRAGRDDQLAHCILLYRFADVFRQSTMVFTEQTGLENLYAMVAYCNDSKRCRRSIIAQHFGERWESTDCNQMCDQCVAISNTTKEVDCTSHCKTLYAIIRNATALEERLTAQKLVDSWVGKGPPKLRTGEASKLPRPTCELVVSLLLLEGFLKEEFHFTPYSTISYINTGLKALSVESGRTRVFLEFPTRKRKHVDSNKHTTTEKTVSPKSTLKATEDDHIGLDSKIDIELDFNEWEDIPSSREEKRTTKRQRTEVKTEVVEVSD